MLDLTEENLPLRCRQDPRWAAEEIAQLRTALRLIANAHPSATAIAREALRDG